MVTDLARTTRMMRSPLDPLPHEIVQLVTLAEKGKLKGQLGCTKGLIADLGGYVTSYALQYLTHRDPDNALACLQVAAEAYAKNGHQTDERPAENGDEDEPGRTWPVPPNAVYRPCREPTCKMLITQIVTRLDGHGKPVYLPVTRDGQSHFLICGNPKRFSKGDR